MERLGLDWRRLEWLSLGWVCLDRPGVEWLGLGWVCLDRPGVERLGMELTTERTCRKRR